MAEREILGHIDCPSCGTKGGMRVTLDKNREPFGFCEAECNQQLRIGGSPRRVALFVALYPWASGKAAPVTVTDTEKPKAEPKAEPVPEARPKPAPKAEPKAEPKRGGFAFGL